MLAALGRKGETAGAHEAVCGEKALKRAAEIDQTPIGRTPRSVPATYLGVWDDIRALYARTPEARANAHFEAAKLAFELKLWERATSLAGNARRLSLDPASTVFELAGMLAALAPKAQERRSLSSLPL